MKDEFPSSGSSVLRNRRPHPVTCLSVLVSMILILGGCNFKKEAPAAAVLPPTEVTVSKPVSQAVTDFVEFTGTTAPIESVEIRSRVTGFLQALHFEPRQLVEKDAKLYTIDRRPFVNAVAEARAALAGTKAELLKAQSDFEKVEKLLATGDANQDEFTAAKSKRDAMLATADAQQAAIDDAELSLSWCEVQAPIKGRISRTQIDAGNLISADSTVLAQIVNDESVYAYFNANEREVLEIRDRRRQEEPGSVGEGKTIISAPVQLALMTDEGFPHPGVIDYAATGIDPGTGTLEVRAKFPNEQGLLVPGLFVRVRVPLGKEYQALMVTERALGSDQGQPFLLTVNESNVVEYRPVKLGRLRDGLRVITDGVKPEDRVIINGIQRVRPGVTVKANDGPMVAGAAPTAAAGSSPSSPTEPASN